MTLHNLGALYGDMHRLAEAEAALQEALTLRRQLAQGHPAAYGPGVATMLYHVGALYGVTGRLAEAEAVLQEALTLQRQFARTNPAAYLPDVAATLHVLAGLAQARPQDAIVRVGEAVTIRRTLWQHELEPGAHGNALAQSLELEAVTLKRTGAETPAVCTRLREAVRVVADARLTHVVHQRL